MKPGRRAPRPIDEGAVPRFWRRRLSDRARAALAGGLIVCVGLAGSLFVASELRANARASNRASFESATTDIANTLDAKLDTSAELTRTMRAIATLEPNVGQQRLLAWYQELQRGTLTPHGLASALIRLVPAAQLPAFRREVAAEPAFRAALGGKLQVVPPGDRPSYCLIRGVVGGGAQAPASPGLIDYCAPAAAGSPQAQYGALFASASTTGKFVVTPLPAPGTPWQAVIAAAVYRRTASLDTNASRRAATAGVIGTTFESGSLIGSAIGEHHSIELNLYHENAGGSEELIGRSAGARIHRTGGFSVRRSFGADWLIEATGTGNSVISADGRALLALGLGVFITVLLLMLYLVLSRSRSRAWVLVDKRTDELDYTALHDALTDLPNRALVLDRAEQLIARARRLAVPVTALFMDIDGFKQINERHGRAAGDEILRRVAARLQTVLRDNDTVGRLGADDFLMLVDSAGLDAAPELVAERLLDVIRQPMELSELSSASLSITASVGIATGVPKTAETLIQDADLARQEAKALGGNRYAHFESAMQTAAQDRIHLEMDLGEALQERQFFIQYQPVVSLDDERIVGVEALLRWRHPRKGLIVPEQFIPIAEASGLIVPIGRWVLEEACTQASKWRRRGYLIDIAVNVSARQLERPELIEEVRGALSRSGLTPGALTLEITETALMRTPDATAELLGGLKTLGVRVAIDDFGTGYSSLAYLRQFPVDTLKIDRTFITGLAVSSEARTLVHTLIQLGSALGLQTLAEGIENHDQVRILRREGCELAQGFLFARPLSPEDLEVHLERALDTHGAATPALAPAGR
jgi:diguanylate cyclase (GGDEF)-like protein